MNSTELLRSEVSHYLILADALKERYGELDHETLKDTPLRISDPEHRTHLVLSYLWPSPDAYGSRPISSLAGMRNG